MRKKDGFPEALFDNWDQLVELSKTSDALVAKTPEGKALNYLLMGDFSIGALRQADMILAEQVVVARKALDDVFARLEVLSGRATNQTGGVTEDQA